MEPDAITDSYITDTGANGVCDAEWTAMQLMHSSRRSWCDVYTCQHRGRRVVLKCLKPGLRDSETHAGLLRKEYEVASMMHHENIVSVLGMETVPGLGPAIVMEHVEGTTLGRYIEEAGPLGRREIETVVRQLCAAVSYIHSRQVVHRDLKPSNILVTRGGRYLRLIDFGMSWSGAYAALNFPGGTEGFTAPECLEATEDAGPGADVWSIGRIIDVMRGGRYGCLDSVVRRCTARDPSVRPADVGELPAMVSRALGRSRRLSVAVAAAVALGLGVAALWYAMPRGTDEPVAEAVEADRVVETIAGAGDSLNVAATRESVSPAVAVAGQSVAAAGAAEGLPIEEQLYKMARECAERRFAEHLHTIDTMTTAETNALTIVGHWRWLAREDVRRWLEGIYSKDNPHIETLMASVARSVEAYGAEDAREIAETRHRRAAIKRNPDLAGATTGVSYPLGDDRIYTRTLQEDGSWTEEVSTPRRHDQY